MSDFKWGTQITTQIGLKFHTNHIGFYQLLSQDQVKLMCY